ncbi:MAG: GTPase Era [Oscillospiraceae bacterium]|jgi:GTP-binding protein Era|nr:GTPase Era [Oscillospiraceae bacterium]
MNTKSAFVAIVGRPNVGKSSLLNAFVGEKVAIVTSKPQTTRTRITGVLTRGDTQLVFIDTPGIHNPKTKLSNYMVRQIKESVADVDISVLVCEPTGPVADTERDLIESFKARKMPAILAVNKIDALPRKDMMMEKIAALSALYDFSDIVPISVTQGDGLGILLDKISGFAAEGPHFFDDDAYTDQPERVIVAEIIREKLLENLMDELPHGIAVGIERMKEREDGDMMDIHAVIYCEKGSHKGMVIGKKGAMLKKIGTLARQDIERFLACRINLQCWVRVKDDWRNREGLIREFGFK